MGTLKHYSPTLIFVGFIGASLLVGWFLPGFYAWTDSDQSRPSPLLWQVPLWSAIVAVTICVSLPWLPIASDKTHAHSQASMRYSIRAMLLVTTGVAIAVAVLTKYSFVGGGIVTAGILAYFLRFYWLHPQHRLAAFALVACMLLPYAWVVGYDERVHILPMVIVLIGAFPTLFPSIWISGLAGVHFGDSPGLAFLLTALELAAGLWIIRIGPKRTIAYLLWVLLTSAMGSLVFYQLVRA